MAALPEEATVQIVDPYETTIAVNAHLLISQFCASQDDYENINIDKLQSLIRENKDGLFSYDVGGRNRFCGSGDGSRRSGNSSDGKPLHLPRYTYTVSFAGDAYFADHVFYLSEEQKELAENYASNLTLFFGAASGTAMAINLSDEVLAYRPLVSEIAARYGMSGLRGTDPCRYDAGIRRTRRRRSHAGIRKRIQYPVSQRPRHDHRSGILH